MPSHQCLRCKKEFDIENESVKCPFCGFRIIAKTRPEFRKKLEAV